MNPETEDPARHDVVAILMIQHQHIQQLLRRVDSLRGTAKSDAFVTLAHYLERHESAEQQVVFPVARDALKFGPAIIAERVGEEHRAHEMLTKLRKLHVDDPLFDDTFGEFRESVLAHAVAEEAEVFARLRAALPVARLVAMASELTAAEAAMA